MGDVSYNALESLAPTPSANLYLRYRYLGSNLDWGASPYGALWDIRLEKPLDNSLLRLEHGYNAGRNVTRVMDSAGGDFAYEYDEMDRLRNRRIYQGAIQEWFDYNAIGNILSKNGSPYTYHATKNHAVVNDGTQPYDYDPNGNMTQYIKYAAENRPVKVSSDVGGAVYIARFAVDGDGRRVKRVDNFGTVHYVGTHYERNVGTGSDTTEVITKFYHAQMGRVSRLIAFRKGGTLYYVVPDHLGGTLRVVDTSGNTIDDIRYHAFGATRSGGGNTPMDKRFTGQTLDVSTGLYWYASRAFDPSCPLACRRSWLRASKTFGQVRGLPRY